jgi:hypothetical protein
MACKNADCYDVRFKLADCWALTGKFDFDHRG